MHEKVFFCNHCFFSSFSRVSILAMSLRNGFSLPLSFLRVPFDDSIRNFISSERSCSNLSFRSVSLNCRIVFILIRVITLIPLQFLQKSLLVLLIFLLFRLIRFRYLVLSDLLEFLLLLRFLFLLSLVVLLVPLPFSSL